MVAAACGDDGVDVGASSTTSGVTTSIATSTTQPTTTTSQGTTTTVPIELLSPPEFGRWTVILESLAVGDYTQTDATERAEAVVGLDTGVLLSDDYPSLNPGYWVVFTGDFAAQDGANDRCSELQAVDQFCYDRFLGELEVAAPLRANARMLAWVDSELAVVSLEEGIVERIVTSDFEGGVFPAAPVLVADGSVAYFGAGFEDYWYECDTSAGAVFEVQVEDGAWREIAEGFGPALSPDGSRLAYIASGSCIPNPDTEIEVISFADTVVVRDLTTGTELRWGPSPGLVESDASLINTIAWDGAGESLFVAMGTGSLLRLDPSIGSPLDALPEVGAGIPADTFRSWRLSGVHAGTGMLIVAEWDFESGNTRIIEVDPGSGAIGSVLGTYDGFAEVSLDGPRQALVVFADGAAMAGGFDTVALDKWISGGDW